MGNAISKPSNNWFYIYIYIVGCVMFKYWGVPFTISKRGKTHYVSVCDHLPVKGNTEDKEAMSVCILVLTTTNLSRIPCI
jgi:hypothetical protein